MPDSFLETIYDYYHQHGRHDLPWRMPEADGSFSPYKILVSEMMLQQTQVARVIPKYAAFLQQFPTAQALADTPLATVLQAWSGLGYNRRAKYLHEAAQALAGKPTWTMEDLLACKGIGHGTAAAVMVYAYDQPIPFIETNVRTVYIHHFFANRQDVSDREIAEPLNKTFDATQPRQFAWALMDYGTHLKATAGNASRRSRHYAKQSKFEGSLRQIRGAVLRALLNGGKSFVDLSQLLPDERLEAVLDTLIKEGLIIRRDQHFYLP